MIVTKVEDFKVSITRLRIAPGDVLHFRILEGDDARVGELHEEIASVLKGFDLGDVRVLVTNEEIEVAALPESVFNELRYYRYGVKNE